MNYIMEHADEGQRVKKKTDVGALRKQLTAAGIRAGMRVLDLGCAEGIATRTIADLVGPEGSVVGVDISKRRIDEAMMQPGNRGTIEYRVGEANCLPSDDCAFDFAWSRFLFEYLPDTRGALDEMIRVVKPDGVVAVSDLDGNCVWHEPMAATIRDAVDEALATLGDEFDPHVGRRLFPMFTHAALVEVSADIRPYHIVVGRIDDWNRALWSHKLSVVAQTLIKRGWSQQKAHALIHSLMAHLDNPHSMTYSVMFTVTGHKCSA